jgi:hypothetical protein
MRSSQSPPNPPNRAGRMSGIRPESIIAFTFSGGMRRRLSARSTWGATAAAMPRARSITSARLIRRSPVVEVIVAAPKRDSFARLSRAARRGKGGEPIFRRGIPPNAKHSFKHPLVQDADYSTLLRSPRQQSPCA